MSPISAAASALVVADEIVAARRPWARVLRKGETLRLVDVDGQQAVDFLCFDADDPSDRYSATNTIKVRGNVYIGPGSVLYSDRGHPLLVVTTDTIGRHDTVYGCCSRPNNLLRYGKPGDGNCYDNFREALSWFGLDERSIVPNINFFMSVPINADGSAGVAADASPPGSMVELRAERDVLAVLSNCPQMLNPCNGFNPTPIRATVLGS